MRSHEAASLPPLDEVRTFEHHLYRLHALIMTDVLVGSTTTVSGGFSRNQT